MSSRCETATATAWPALTIDDVTKELGTAPTGLTAIEAARRLGELGPNEIQAAARISAWWILLEQFQNVLIIILLGATAVSALMGHTIESLAIAVIVLFAVILGFIQEFRAERAIDALRKMAAPHAKVIRDGRELDIAAREVVPGDVVLLQPGDRVPADGRLVEAVNLRIEESVLTGESVPVEKQTAPLTQPDLAVGDRLNMAFGGTVATYGRGRAVIVATGMQTEFGKIAQMLHAVDAGRTPLQQNLDKVGRTLAKGAFGVVAVIVALGLWRGQPFLEMLIFGIALAVAVVPEALPAVVTISLALGVQRMVKRNALMRRLPAVETLGSTSVICSDKTGTLTKDEMTVREVYVAGRFFEVTGSGYAPDGQFHENGLAVELCEPLKRLLQAATLASDASIRRDGTDGRWEMKGDPTEGALVVAAAKAGLAKSDLEARFPRVDEIPFTSETKRMTTLHRTPDGILAHSKGAPEIILESCTRLSADEGEAELSGLHREHIGNAARQMADKALRVLAVAAKSGTSRETAECDMTFLGLLGMIDPPRPEARAAIATCRTAGIRTVMITGDHPLTAQAVARELGILNHGRVVSGADLEGMGDDELKRDVAGIEVFARVSPAHKLRIVTALQQQGHIVAMTGDGVNDAPALKKADIGIAMGIAGTDVTREAAAMTLTDDNFASIVAAVEEGRGIFENIKKYLMFLLSSNIGEIGLMAAASVAGLPLPLTAVQILYVNLATDGLPALALAVDPPDPDRMSRPPRPRGTGIFTRPVVTLMSIGGAWSALMNVGLFAWALESGRPLQHAMTLTFVSLVLIQFVKAYNFRSDRHSVLIRPFANKWLNLAILWELLLLALIVHVPFLQIPFETVGLTPWEWCLVILLAFTISPVLEMAKWCERRNWFGTM